jgi:hypothetical protein
VRENRDVEPARRLLRFGYAVLLRALASIGGAVSAYGATGMFTTAGIMPPNVIVIVGLGLCAAVILALWSSERRLSGIWPAFLLAGVPFSLYALGSWATAECAPDHPPITPTFSCSPVGTHALAVVAPILTLFALVLLVRDVWAIARR